MHEYFAVALGVIIVQKNISSYFEHFSRDISFLYDATSTGIHVASPTTVNVPESLIPNEYHIVKHSGVLGLDLYDEYVII